MTSLRPSQKPLRANFSSGPCCKRPGWSWAALNDAAIGRSHRSNLGKEKLAELIERNKKVLRIPDDYRVGIVPGSDTSATEMILWNFLGTRPVTVLAWDVFGTDWGLDVTDHLKLERSTTVLTSEPGKLPDLKSVNFDHDVVFTWNGTTTGVWIPDGSWIPNNRKGMVICDAISAVFAREIPWEKLDAVCYSWQKGLGSEAAHGMIVLSPRAVEFLNTHTPSWPLPKVFRLKENDAIREGLFKGLTINTPSLMCVEDCLDALKWSEDIGGLDELIKRSQENLKIVTEWVSTRSHWIDFLVQESDARASTSITLRLTDKRFSSSNWEELWSVIKPICAMLEKEGVAFDIKGHERSFPCFRIWGGPTVDAQDVRLMLPWIEWAYHQVVHS